MEFKRSDLSSSLNSWERSDKHRLVEKREMHSFLVGSSICDRLLEVGEPVIISEVFQFRDVMKLIG
eukprot:10280622-Ditylum_brightwellii.AAC.1